MNSLLRNIAIKSNAVNSNLFSISHDTVHNRFNISGEPNDSHFRSVDVRKNIGKGNGCCC